MDDEVQDDLIRWIESGERAAGARAVRAIAQEWRPLVARFLRYPAEDLVDEELQAALVALCAPRPGVEPRVLAPRDTARPSAWRVRVLKNHLVDRVRHQARRRHAEDAAGAGHAPAVEAEAWRQRRSGGPTLTPAPPAPDRDRVEADALTLSMARSDRAAVLRALPALPIRRRVLVALALGFDVTSLIPEIAAALEQSPADVRERLDRVAQEPAAQPGAHEHLTDPMVRVLYPDGSIEKARESARKALERGVETLRAELGGPS